MKPHLVSPKSKLCQDLQKGDERETALLELSKRRESLQDLALGPRLDSTVLPCVVLSQSLRPILWHSFGTIVALIQDNQSTESVLAAMRKTSQSAHAQFPCICSHSDA